MHVSFPNNLLIFSNHHYSASGIAPSPPIQTHTSHDPSFHCDEGLTRETSASLSLQGENFTLTNLFDTKVFVR